MLNIRRFILDEEGATAIEYALIGSLASILIIASITAMSGAISGNYEYIRTTVLDATGAPAS